MQIVGYQNCHNTGFAESVLTADKLWLTLTMCFANLLKSNKSLQRYLMEGDSQVSLSRASPSLKVTGALLPGSPRPPRASSSDIEVPS